MNILERCSSLGRRNDPSLAGKSLLQNILRVSPCGSRFCRDPFQSRLTKSFRINTLAIVTKKTWRDYQQAKSLFWDILAVSHCGSILCTDSTGSMPGKSLRMNILENAKEKKWRLPISQYPLPDPATSLIRSRRRRQSQYEFSAGSLFRESTRTRKPLDAACCIL